MIFGGLLAFVILLASVPALPMMGDVSDPTIAPLDMTTAATSSALLDSVMDMKKDAPIGSSSTLLETPTTSPIISSVTDNMVQEPVSTTTTILVPVTEPTTILQPNNLPTISPVTDKIVEELVSTTTIALAPITESTTIMQPVDSNSIDLPDTPSVVATIIAPMPLPAETTAMSMTAISQDKSELGDTIQMTVPTMNVSAVPIEAAGIPTIGIEKADPLQELFNTAKVDNTMEAAGNPTIDFEKPDALQDLFNTAEADNVFSMASNEETTRMASSTDPKVDSADKQVLPLAAGAEAPKSQKTQEDGGSSGNKLATTSLVVLAITTVFVIV